MSNIKEPGFFVEELSLNKGDAWYYKLFADAGNAIYVGESSTHYTKLPTYKGVPERIRKFCQDPRFIYIMRDPIERTISHYWHNVRMAGEHRSMINAIKANSEYTDFSYYAMQLKAYFNIFGQDKFYVLTFENLIKNPDAELRQLLDWLNLESRQLLGDLRKQHNKSPDNFMKARGLGLLYKFRSTDAWDSLSRLTPKTMSAWGVRLSEKDGSRDKTEDDDLVQYLQDLQKIRGEELMNLLGMEFPEWTTTMGPTIRHDSTSHLIM